MAALVIAEHEAGRLRPGILNTVSAARQLSDEVAILVMGEEIGAVAEEAAAIEGVGRVIAADDPRFAGLLAEVMAPVAAAAAGAFDAVLAPASTFGKNLLPRVAALLDVAPVSDVIAINGDGSFDRPIYAGNAIATVRPNDLKKILTIRPTAFPAAPKSAGAAAIEALALPEPTAAGGRVAFVGAELTRSERPELTSARVVISGGRGMGDGKNFKLLEEVADKLGAAIGASRSAVDAGFVPNDYQVGQTGKIVAPELYIAVGISGAIQHLAGMKDSKVIVAINKDEDAPIFEVADYGLVADLFEALPALAAELDKHNGGTA